MTHQEARKAARDAYKRSVKAGEPLSGAKLGAEFGRSERWGRERIRDVKTEEDRRTQFALASRNPGLAATALLMERGELDEHGKRTPLVITAEGAYGGAAASETKGSGTETASGAGLQVAAAGSSVNEPPAAPAVEAERQTPAQPRGAAAVAWLALVLGIGASVGANILHTVTVIGSGGAGSWPQVAGAAFWPVALVVAIEVMARVRWPQSWGYALVRFAGVGAVAVVAAVVSYRHMSGLLAHWGEDPLSAHLGPIAVDGLVTVGALALLAIHKARKES